MANIGEQLLQPEAGWQRFNYNDTRIKIVGGYPDSGGYKNSLIVNPASITIYFTGTSIRLLCSIYDNQSTDVLVTIDGKEFHYSAHKSSTVVLCGLAFEKTNLKDKPHKLVMKNNNGGDYTLDAVDILDDKKLLTEDEYNRLITLNSLIYDNGTYKNYDATNNKLVEVTDIDSVFTNYTGIKDLNKIIPFIPSFSEGWKIVSNKNFNLKVDALKLNKEMITTLEPLNMRAYDVIHNITGDYVIENNGVIKFIFSFDKGSTWKTYDITNSKWNTVSASIPIKLYNNFSDDEKTNWNNARDTILSDGISVQNLGNVDFQSIKTDKLMFAVAFNRPSYADTCTLKGLNINYDGLTTYIQLAVGSDLSKYEAKATITGDTVGVTTSSNQDKILVTMTTNI